MKRIFILRPDNIGDAVLFSGWIPAIRQHWAEHRIVVIVQRHVRNLYDLCPDIDSVWTTDRLLPWNAVRRRVQRGSWWLERLLKRPRLRSLWSPSCDVLLYPVGAPTEEFLEAVRFVHASEKIGFGGIQRNMRQLDDSRNAPEQVFTRWVENTRENEWWHELERHRLFFSALGIGAEDVKPRFWLSEQDRAVAAELVPHREVLGVFVGASRREREWPLRNWAELITRQNRFRTVVILGGGGDREDEDHILRMLGTAVDVKGLCGRTTLRELAACIGRCAAVVSNDSAGLHMAVASNVPTVGILGGYEFGRFYPWGNPAIHRVASIPMPCYRCRCDCVHGDVRCVSGIPVETVLKELDVAAEAHPCKR